MKILYLCPRVPYPPDRGERIRAYHELRHLGRRHHLHVLTLAERWEEERAAEGLREHCRKVEVFPTSRALGYLRVLLGAASARPLTLAFYRSRALGARVRELAGKPRFDVVVAHGASMAPYAELVPGTPKVLDMVEVGSSRWSQYASFSRRPRRLVYGLEAGRLRAWETAVPRRFDRVVLATGRETQQLQSFAPDVQAVVVRNGVSLDFFRCPDLPKSPNPRLIFTGQMNYFANVDGVVHFARLIFPRLRRRFSDLDLVVVGRSPTARVRALQEEIPGVRVTGAVGDVRPFLARSTVFVAPLRIAQGVQNKVLEAMASELPVVVTEPVMAGLADGGFQPGRDLLVAAGDGGLEAAVARLLEDPGLRVRVAAAGRRRLAATHVWEHNMEEFETVLACVSGDRPATAERPVVVERWSHRSGTAVRFEEAKSA